MSLGQTLQYLKALTSQHRQNVAKTNSTNPALAVAEEAPSHV